MDYSDIQTDNISSVKDKDGWVLARLKVVCAKRTPKMYILDGVIGKQEKYAIKLKKEEITIGVKQFF